LCNATTISEIERPAGRKKLFFRAVGAELQEPRRGVVPPVAGAVQKDFGEQKSVSGKKWQQV